MAKKKPSGQQLKKSKAKKKASPQQAWPLPRDVLFRPERFKYVRKIDPPSGCVFCASASGKISVESLCFYQSKHSMIILNKFPYNSGHVLILPRRHCGDLLALEEAEYVDLMQTVRLAMAAAKSIYQPTGINVGLNHGATAGAGIPEHLHFHLIPRWAGDLNFFPLIANTKVVIETLEQTWQRYHDYFLEKQK